MMYSQHLYPLTGLRPPIYKLANLSSLYTNTLAGDEDKMIDMLKQYQPTIITTIMYRLPGVTELPGNKVIPRVIEKTNLYEKIITVNAPNIILGAVYRLKNYSEN